MEHARTTTPYGPVRTRVTATSTAITLRFILPAFTFPMSPDIVLPDQIVSQYPMSEAAAVDSSISRKPSDMKPSRDSPAISPMARAVPDLPLPETDSVTRERTAVTVPIEATVDMKRSGLSSGNTAADMEAPTVDVIPGNQPATVPISTPLSPGTMPTGSATRSLCSGIPEDEEDSRRTGIPNRPVSMGSMTLPSPRTPSMGISRVMQASPSIPDTAKAAAPQTTFPRRRSEARIAPAAARRTNGVRRSSPSPRPWRRSHCRGTDIRTAAEAPTRLPIAAALTATIPRPCLSSLCPGRTDTASSPSGAPMKTDGTKSTNECTTDADIMQQQTAIDAPSASRCPDTADTIAGCAVRSIAARVLTWIPGASPLNSPIPAPAIVMTMQNPTSTGSMGEGCRCRVYYGNRVTQHHNRQGTPPEELTASRHLTGTPSSADSPDRSLCLL